MDEANGSPADNQPNADPRIAELEAKYNELSRRYAASSEEGKRLAQQVQQFQQAYAPQPTNRPSWEQRLEESAIPVDALNQLIDARAGQLVQQSFEPIQRGIQARQNMVGEYGDAWTKFESQTGELFSKDPEFQQTYNRIFAVEPAAAMELAFLKLGYKERKGRRSKVDESELNEAQIPSQRSGDTRRGPQGHSGAIEEARRAYNQNPNKQTAMDFARAKMAVAIPDEFLNQ